MPRRRHSGAGARRGSAKRASESSLCGTGEILIAAQSSQARIAMAADVLYSEILQVSIISTRDPTHEHPVAHAHSRRRPNPRAAHGRHSQGRHPRGGPDRAARSRDADDPAATAVPAVKAVLAGGDLAL